MPAQLTFDGGTLEAVLARVADEHGPAARILGAEKVRSGGVAGFFARERYEVVVEVPEATAEGDADLSQPPGTGPTPQSIIELAEQVNEAERRDSTVPSTPSSPAPASVPSGGLSTEGRTFQEVLDRLVADAGLSTSAFQRAAPQVDPGAVLSPPSPIAAPLPQEDGPPQSEPPGSSLVAALTALGVPRDLLVGMKAAGSQAQQVLAALEQLLVPPPPLIVGRGDVVVVVGERAVAVEAAAVAAAQLGQMPADVVVAGAGRTGVNSLRGPEDAATRRPAWRRCAPTVVAVCVHDDASGRAWAQEMIAALEPVTVWAAVRADRKPEDVATWATAIGDIAALALGACSETVSPASMLATGLPIAALEGRRSTPAAWTALLVERMTS